MMDRQLDSKITSALESSLFPVPEKAAPARLPIGRGTRFAWSVVFGVVFGGLGMVAYQLVYWRARGAFYDLVAGLTTEVREGFAIIAALVAIFFLPTINAVLRQHNNAVQIFLVNILLGWTFLGWVVALVWSTTGNVFRAAPQGAARKCCFLVCCVAGLALCGCRAIRRRILGLHSQ